MAKPTTDLPTWASNELYDSGDDAGEVTKIPPGAGEMADGYHRGKRLPPRKLNYLLHWLLAWVRHLIDTRTAAQFSITGGTYAWEALLAFTSKAEDVQSAGYTTDGTTITVPEPGIYKVTPTPNVTADGSDGSPNNGAKLSVLVPGEAVPVMTIEASSLSVIDAGGSFVQRLGDQAISGSALVRIDDVSTDKIRVQNTYQTGPSVGHSVTIGSGKILVEFVSDLPA